MPNGKFCTIIIAHYAMNAERSEVMRRSLLSLIDNTEYPLEIIVSDNGDSMEDSEFLLGLASKNLIQVYLRNGSQMHFGYARNQGLSLAQGDYLCIADNDIRYMEGWLGQCIKVLEAHPDKDIYATPLEYPTVNMKKRYDVGKLDVDGVEYNLNCRAGSNCFVVRREDFRKIGGFLAHRIAGSHWTDAATKAGYVAAVLPEIYAEDMGLRRGYALQEAIPIKLDLKGSEYYFNEDQYRRDHPEEHYIQQRYTIS